MARFFAFIECSSEFQCDAKVDDRKFTNQYFVESNIVVHFAINWFNFESTPIMRWFLERDFRTDEHSLAIHYHSRITILLPPITARSSFSFYLNFISPIPLLIIMRLALFGVFVSFCMCVNHHNQLILVVALWYQLQFVILGKRNL